MIKLKAFILILAGILSFSVSAQQNNPPIAVPFNLKTAGYVTLVIEDKDGVRVRNLISETWFKAGANTVWWDGLDDLGRDIEAAHHGLYHIPSRLVAPGTYTVRGLVHDEIKASYEFAVNTSGNPPWDTDDHTGGWLANHSQPQAAVYVPAEQSLTKQPSVFLGCFVSEGQDGLAWVDLDGHKKGGIVAVGGAWTAASYLARDAGDHPMPGVAVYAGSVWETGKLSGQLELRFSVLTRPNKPLLLYPMGPLDANGDGAGEIGGLAVYNGLAVVSLTKKKQLLFIDIKTAKVIGTSPVDAPRGLVFDAKGNLLVLSGNHLLKYTHITNAQLPAPQSLVTSQLEAPVGLAADTEGKFYISDGGNSNQVKVFTAEGKFVRAIGKAGASKGGLYDPLHMNSPAGITVDSKQQLWVTEHDYLPKRVSVWSLEGNLIKAFYGPSKYGGGGTLDPGKNKFYYAEEEKGTLEFDVDWKTGTYKLNSVLYRRMPGDLDLPVRSASPETPLYYKGKRYFTDCYNSNPTNGHLAAFLFTERNGTLFPAAAMGRADFWPILKSGAFKSRWPAGVDLTAKGATAFFSWTDLNADAKVQPDEVNFIKGSGNGITIAPDLSFDVANLDGSAMQFSPVSFTAAGIPVYQLDHGKVLVKGVQIPGSDGGDQVIAAPNGWTVVTQGILPFERYSLSGAKDGKAVWSYPNLWPGLHPSHEAPIPSFPGELIAPTRLLGGLVEPKGSDAGALWAINSNHGMVYLFTADGLFVTTLFEPMRTGKRWKMPVAERGMSLNGLSLSEENFWPSITQTTDGQIYLTDGGRSSIVRIDGLPSISRLAPLPLVVSKEDLQKSSSFQLKSEAARQQAEGTGALNVNLINTPVTVDGKLDDWTGADWASIDKRGVKAYFNSYSKPYDVAGAVTVSGDHLYAAYRTGDAGLLKNSGEIPMAPFKTGGALDIMIGTDGTANPNRTAPVAGDLRLLITLLKGKPYALLYRAVANGAKPTDKVPFSSPWRTITFDQVQDVSAQVSFAASSAGDYEISIPLSVLDLKPKAGLTIKGDIGILRGDNTRTLSRVYWNNKATGIVSDVPSEAELTPNLWGTWKFVNP
ncbi:hypothetical protein [Pedobacter sp. L105]|uniref:hypothetical protein n=1 Tax=Pedobacter sp. L105 TaxID=1641871 RepID=UPI00131C1741|nr:hypothetical protein [Pedobacter sp. L105]